MEISREALEGIFSENFSARSELGAAVSIWQGETEIVSLAGGQIAKDSDAEWTPDTLVPIWSSTKGPAALCVLLALHRAGRSVHEPVVSIWPELLAAQQSEKMTIAQLLGHQSGLAALDADNRPSIHRHGDVVRAMEKQQPFWTPGRGHGYHPRTSGALLEELVRRATGGTTLGEFWKSEIATPLDLDVHIGGLGAAEIDRLATIYPPKSLRPREEEKPFYQALADPKSLSLGAFASPGGMKALGDINKMEYLQSGIPSLGAVASARGIAKFYAVMAAGGQWEGVQAIPRELTALASSVLSTGSDHVLLIPTAFSAGWMKDPTDADSGEKLRQHFGPSQRAYGQPGAGGSHAFADPEHGLGFGYVMNQMETGILPNDKSLLLVEALYER